MPRIHKNYRGFHLNIENPAGTVRKGRGWRTLMRHHYGEISGTKGVDGDCIDIFLPAGGPISSRIFAIHQRDPRTGIYDEDKLILGAPNENEAVDTYLEHYADGDAFLMNVTEWTVDDLAEVLLSSKGEPGKLDKLAKIRWLK